MRDLITTVMVLLVCGGTAFATGSCVYVVMSAIGMAP